LVSLDAATKVLNPTNAFFPSTAFIFFNKWHLRSLSSAYWKFTATQLTFFRHSTQHWNKVSTVNVSSISPDMIWSFSDTCLKWSDNCPRTKEIRMKIVQKYNVTIFATYIGIRKLNRRISESPA
jgi:hypothetical protein